MPRLTLDEAQDALPHLDELRPVFDHLLAGSQPNPARAWAGSGPLGTSGARFVASGSFTAAAAGLARDQAALLGEVYAAVARVLDALEAGDRSAAAMALLDAAALEERHDRPDRAEAYAEAAYRTAREGKDQASTSLALRRSARAARAQGRLTEALQRYTRSHEIALSLSRFREAAEAAVGAGNVLEEQGRWSESATWYQRALSDLEGAGEPTPERWHALLNLHIVTRSSGALDESVEWLRRAEDAAAQTDPEAAGAFLLNAWGQLMMARGRFAEAEERFQQALNVASGARAHITVRLNLAEALLAQGRSLEAAEHAREAERDAIRTGTVPKLPEVYRLLGRIADADGSVDAFVLFERALQIIRNRNLPALEEALTLQAYADVEARRGDAGAAHQLRERARERFAAIGMAHERQSWADVYAGPADDEDPTSNEGTGHVR